MKLQVAIEFVSYSIIFLIAMGLMLSIVVLLGNDQVLLQKHKVLKGKTEEITSSIVFARSVGNNFDYKINLEPTINGVPYVIYLRRRGIAIVLDDYERSSYSVTTPLAFFVPSGNAETLSPGEVLVNSTKGKEIVLRILPTPGHIEVELR